MDPIQAANILLGIWDVLHRDSDQRPARPDGGLTTSEAELAARQVVEREYVQLQERLDRLVLVVHAMWSVVSEKAGVTDADLLKRISDLDAADGTVDGRVLGPPFRCSCGAMVSRRLNRCLFCGKQYAGGTAFSNL